VFPILGGLANALDLSVFFTAIRYTRVASATLLNNTAPIWVALVAWLVFKERLKGFFWVGLFVALIGAGVVLGSDFLLHPSLNPGNLLALLSSLFYASYYLATQQGRRRLNAIQYTYLMTLSSGAFNLLFTLLFHLPLTGFNLGSYLASVGAGVVTQSMGFLALSYALGHLSASTVSPTMLLQPVLTALLAIPLIGEALQPGQWIGGLATLGGIYLVNHSFEAPAEPAQEPVDAVLKESLSRNGGPP
jgi:drug/metabolite transporter (DMT)-like permease